MSAPGRGAEIEECAYCTRDVAAQETVPAVSDDEAWETLAREHSATCEWVRTRAHRRFDDGAKVRK